MEHVPVIAVKRSVRILMHNRCRQAGGWSFLLLPSIATTLVRAGIATRLRFVQDSPIHSLVVSDKEAVLACTGLSCRSSSRVEPACGAALAAVYAPSLCAPCATAKTLLGRGCGG